MTSISPRRKQERVDALRRPYKPPPTAQDLTHAFSPMIIMTKRTKIRLRSADTMALAERRGNTEGQYRNTYWEGE